MGSRRGYQGGEELKRSAAGLWYPTRPRPEVKGSATPGEKVFIKGTKKLSAETTHDAWQGDGNWYR